MFLKFTRLDGTPIWINSTFVVTVEPRRNGGSVVVPIGDGLDYDVREAPEKVLAMLGGSVPAPVAATPDEPAPEETAVALANPEAAPVVAVPQPKALPEKFVDVVANSLSAPQPDEVDSKPIPEPAVMTTTGATTTVSSAETPAPAKKTTRKRKVKAETDGESEEKPKKATRTRKTAKKAEPLMDEGQIERLKKMAPGSLKKLQNTLASQFRIEDVESTVKFLLEADLIKLDQDHVTWSV